MNSAGEPRRAGAVLPAVDLSLGSPFRVLVVDDEPAQVALVSAILETPLFEVTPARDGASALALVAAREFDVVLLDKRMPDIDGDEVCRRIRAELGETMLPIIMVTGSGSSEQLSHSLAAGASDFIRKPYAAMELAARVNAAVTRKRLTDQLESVESVMFALARMVEAKDGDTGDHCTRLARLAVRFGRWLGVGNEELVALRRGGVLHDIGKLGIPESILLKRGALDAAEWTVMRTHTVIGERLCSSMKSFRLTSQIVRSHHERWDGSGYPDGLAGPAIPRLARIFQLCDIYDALTNARAYKPALPQAAALDIMAAEGARGWREPGLLAAFREFVGSVARADDLALVSDDLGLALFEDVRRASPQQWGPDHG